MGGGAARWRLAFSIGAAVLDVIALGASFLPVGGPVCTSGSAPSAQSCHAVPLLYAFDNPVAVAWLTVMVGLGLLPLLSIRLGRAWPLTVSAVAQPVLQVLALGAFWFWLPAWILTLAAAVVAAFTRPRPGRAAAAGPPG